MHILITGSRGFLGRNLVKLFSKSGYTVLAPLKQDVNFAKSEEVDAYFKNNHIDIIIHAATSSMLGKFYPPETCENNLRMFFNLEKNLKSSMKMITLGSGSEYARNHWYRKMPEEYFGGHIPEDSHSYSKYLISKYIQDTKKENIICLRIFGVFGKYENYCFKFISNAIVKSLLGIPITINQNVIYDYLYITDLYKILEYFINHDTKNKILNVTPTESIDLVTVTNIINKLGGNTTEIKILNEGVGVEYSGDNKKLLSDIKDFQFMPYEIAIADLYEYYKKTKDTLDIDSIKQDLFLDYAKKLREKYFIKSNKSV